MTASVTASAATARRPGALQIPSLDGLRAVSFGIVFLAHASGFKAIPGYFGLAVFFFLSGYLITTLLRMECERTGTINFRDFYLRRILRILPPFYLVLALDCLLTWAGVLPNALRPQAVLMQALHLTNYYIVGHGWWTGLAPGSWIFWSLAVEEHFYLVFPVFYLWLRRRVPDARGQAWALAGLCALVLLWRCVLVFGFHASQDRVYVASDTRVDSILFGCLLALYGNPVLDSVPVSERRVKSFWVPLACIALVASFAVHKPWFDQTLRYTVQGLALIPLFVAAIRYPSWGLTLLLNSPWARTVGLLTYTLYLVHTSVLWGLSIHTHWPRAVQGAAGLLISLALAGAVFYGVERPIARLRRRLSHAGGAGPAARGEGAIEAVPTPIPPADVPQTGQKVARNLLATLATQLLSWGLTFLVTLYLPRYAGAAGLGKLAFAASFVGLFGVLVPLGTSTLLVKEIARDRARTGALLGATLALRVPLALVMTTLAVLLVRLFGYPELTRTLVVASALGMTVATVNDALGAALQGQENLPRQSLGVLADKFLGSALTILLILRHAPLWAIAAVGIWTGLVSLAVNLSAFRSLLPTLRLPSLGAMRAVVLAGVPFMGWTVFQTLYGQTDPIVLSLVTNDRTVGWYAAAFRLVGTTMFLPTALTTALLPTLSRLHGESQAEFRQLARRMLLLVMLCGVPVALVLVLMPDRLIALLHYPAGFAGAVPVLRVGGVGVLLWFVGNALGTVVFASDGQARMFRTSVVASLLGIPACFLGSFLGDRLLHNGAVGAIGSDVLLEAFLVGAYLRSVPQGTFGADSLRGVGRCLAAALPAAAVLLWLAGRGWGLWCLPPVMLVYVALCVALGCLRPQDLSMARQAWKGRSG